MVGGDLQRRSGHLDPGAGPTKAGGDQSLQIQSFNQCRSTLQPTIGFNSTDVPPPSIGDVTSVVALRRALNNLGGQILHQRIVTGSWPLRKYNTARARGDKGEAARL